MAKGTGLGARLLVGGYDISGDISALDRIGGGPTALPLTGIDKSAYERIGGVRDGAMAATSYMNDAAGQAFTILKTLPTADTMASYCHRSTIGEVAASINAKQANYDGTRGKDGSLTFASEFLANGYGLEWGRLLTAVPRTDTGATNGAGVDFSGSTAFGLQAYLHVTSFTGTDATIRIQESSDNGVGDAFANVTGGAFTAVTSGPTWQRIETARGLTVERYLRVATSTTGGFSNMQFVVIVVKNDTSVVF